MMSRIPLVSGLCLTTDANPLPGEYVPSLRQVINRPTTSVAGQNGVIAHELCHASQHFRILEAGTPDIVRGTDDNAWLVTKWIATQAGRDYLQAGGYTFVGFGGACVRGSETSCWTQNPANVEFGFQIPDYMNPIEDNAQFCAVWYNPTGLDMWNRARVESIAPRRSAWARQYLVR